MSGTAGPSQKRRRLRRAALTAGATAFKSTLPLSDRDATWDSGAANTAWQKECGIGGDSPDWAKFRSGFLWFDSADPEKIGSGKLPYVDVIDGTPTAVWAAITAAAGGHGVDATTGIPTADKTKVKATISKWYGKAAKQYKDDTIKAPFEKEEAAVEDTETAEVEVVAVDPWEELRARAAITAAADLPWDSELGVMDVMSDISSLLNPGDSWRWWVNDLKIDGSSAILCDGQTGECWLAPVTYDGDKEPVLPPQSEWTAVESEWVEASFDAWQRFQAELAKRAELANAELAMGACDNCDHAYSEHLGTAGPCTTGECSCNGYQNPADESAASSGLHEVRVRITPDVNGFQERAEVELRAALAQASEKIGTFRLVFDNEEGAIVDVVENAATDSDTEDTLPDAHKPGANLPPRRRSPKATDPTPPAGNAAAATGATWTATLCPEAAPTDDGRIFAPGSITWRELPLTLMAMTTTSAEGGHDGAAVAGRIDKIWNEGNLVRASGSFDIGDYGQDIARMVGDGTLRGISVDLAIDEMEIAYRSQVLNADGEWIGGTGPNADEEGPDALDVMFGGSDEEVMFVVWKAIIGMATVCPFQAFSEATIELSTVTAGAKPNPLLWTYTGQAGYVVTGAKPEAAVVASAAAVAEAGAEELEAGAEPQNELEIVLASRLTAAEAGLAPEAPPTEWFDDPELAELTGLVVTDDGRIYGHAAAWDTCHTGFPDACVTAPHSRTGYAYFHLKEIVCDDGDRVTCGTITLDTGHAGGRLSRAQATAHYDNTGTATADVTVGEDEHGIWVAGAIRGDVSEEAVRKLRGAVLSGDWRNVNGNLELVALLAVNVPGFPVPRVKAMIASGDLGPEVLTLTAAGIAYGDEDDEIVLPPAVLAQFKALGDRATGRFAELAARAAATEK